MVFRKTSYIPDSLERVLVVYGHQSERLVLFARAMRKTDAMLA